MPGLGLLNLANDIVWVDSNGIRHKLSESVDPNNANYSSTAGVWWSFGTYEDENHQIHRMMYKVWPDPVAYSSIKVVRVRDLNGNVTDLSETDYNKLPDNSVLCYDETSGYVVFGLINYDGNSRIGNVTRAMPLHIAITNDVLGNGNQWFTLQEVVWNNPWTDLNGTTYTKITVKQNITLNSDSTTNFVGCVEVDGEGSAITYDQETGLYTGSSGIWGLDDTFNIKAGSFLNETCSFGNTVTSISSTPNPSVLINVNINEQLSYYNPDTGSQSTITCGGCGVATVEIGGISSSFSGGRDRVYGQDLLSLSVPANETGSTRSIDITVQGFSNNYVHHITQDPFVTYRIVVGSEIDPTQTINLSGTKIVTLQEINVINPDPDDPRWTNSSTAFTMTSSNTNVAIINDSDHTVTNAGSLGRSIITVIVNGETLKTFEVSVSTTSLYMKIYKGSTEIAGSSNPGQIGTGNTLSGPYNMNLSDGTLAFNFYTDSSCNNQVSGSMTTDSTDNEYVVPNNVNVVGNGSSITVITYSNSDIGQYEFPVLLDGIRLGCIWGNIIA